MMDARAAEAWEFLSGFMQASRTVPENQRAAPGSLPLTVISGFLGAGKTTLLNRLLTEPHGRRIAVLVNDFGRINIDAALVRSRTVDTIDLANGCACCTVAGDLARTIVQIAQRPEPPDAIVIEASGLADPRGIVQVALANPALRLDGVVALADAETLLEHSTDPACARTLISQLDAADVIVLNKRDLVDDRRLDAVRAWLQARASGRPVIEAVQAAVPVDVLLGIDSARVHSAAADPAHASDFESTSMALEAPLDRGRLRQALHELPAGIVRAKGVLWLADDAERRTVYQRVGVRWSLVPSGPWDGEPRLSRLVFIGRKASFDRAAIAAAFHSCVMPTGSPP